MTKIIAFSLWGKDPKYTIGAVRNAELAKEIYPGWVCRFYTGEDVEDHIKQQLLDNNAEVTEMGGADWNGMFWRFFAADGPHVMISRDTDSRLGSREKAAVDEWLASDKDFHIMRDHPYHATEILGGMWGVRNGLLNGIKDMIAYYDTGEYDNKYQVDQNFLRDVVYPLVQKKSMVHDEYFLDPSRRPFPVKRVNAQDFVGQVYDENEVPQF
tara:strand:+ start:267 stop:902 length:636 start_codon:yes stop_codon:yes gene_type:complete